MTDVWFDPIAQELNRAMDGKDFNKMEFVAGVRVNGVPHIGTYLTLASTYVFASQAKKDFRLPAGIRIHFLDNDPVVTSLESDQRSTHFHCVFQNRTSDESSEFVQANYLSYLDELSALTGCSYDWEVYSVAQAESEFRSTVLQSLHRWKDFKYFVSGPPFGTGVRGIGFPCPQCGLFDGWLRPSIDFLSDDKAVLKSECCNHGEYSTALTNFNDTFVNLETTYRNVIKEILALKKNGCLSIMMKGLDWKEGLRNLDSVLEILGISKNETPPRFLVPVIKTASGVKLSKSAIQKSPDDFDNLHPALLDMNVLRTGDNEYPSRILSMAEQVLSDPRFAFQAVLPSDVVEMLHLSA